LLVLTVLNNTTHWAKPSHLFSAWVRYKHAYGIHVDLPRSSCSTPCEGTVNFWRVTIFLISK